MYLFQMLSDMKISENIFKENQIFLKMLTRILRPYHPNTIIFSISLTSFQLSNLLGEGFFLCYENHSLNDLQTRMQHKDSSAPVNTTNNLAQSPYLVISHGTTTLISGLVILVTHFIYRLRLQTNSY